MPELPDVEVFKRYFQSTALHREISGVEIDGEDLLDGISSSRLKENLRGAASAACGVTASISSPK